MEILHLSNPRPYQDSIASLLEKTDDDFYPPLSERSSGVDETNFDDEGTSSVQPYVSDIIDQSVLLVMTEQGRPVGLLSYTTELPDSVEAAEGVYMSTATLLSEYRDQGIASRLVSIVRGIAGDDGLPVYTRTWEHNEASQSLLESQGFEVYKVVENDRRGDVDSIYYKWASGVTQ